MLYTLCILTANCMTAADPPVGYGNCACNNGGAPQPGVVYYDNGPNRNMRARVRNFLGIYPQASPYHTVYSAPIQTGAPVMTSTAAPPMNAPAPQTLNLQVTKKAEDRIGHEDDYSWVTGQLFYVRVDGGKWVLRYGRLDEVDKYGGSVVRAPTVEMRNFREGDIVCVYGQVINEGRASRALGGPLYRVSSINMVDRSDP